MSPRQAYLRPAGDKAHSVEVVIHGESGVEIITWSGRGKKKKELDVLFREALWDGDRG